jgi:hypothetical protein
MNHDRVVGLVLVVGTAPAWKKLKAKRRDVSQAEAIKRTVEEYPTVRLYV